MSDVVLTKETILGADDLSRKRVEVPEWGGDVYVRTMSGVERDAFENDATARRAAERYDTDGLMALLVVQTVCDEDGKSLFTKDDIPALNTKSCKVIGRLFTIALKMNDLRQKDIEELAGN